MIINLISNTNESEYQARNDLRGTQHNSQEYRAATEKDLRK